MVKTQKTIKNMNRKALLIGIDDYCNAKLNCCLNDVAALESSLKYNFDKSINFNVKTITDSDATKANIRGGIKDLFKGEGEIALFYFSGHGIDDHNDGFIVSYDYEKDDYGVSMNDILKYAKDSKYKYKIIVLDCCHAGFVGNYGLIGDTSILPDNVVIMTASRKDESSIEVDGHGVFTNLFIEAINGGAADILGNITPGSIYSFIDQALGPWEQRPLFKANISSFVSLKKYKEKISVSDLRQTLSLFEFEYSEYKLDPSYEKTNIQGGEHKNNPPYATKEHIDIFTKLQVCNRNGLVVPVDSSDMYFAAMDCKSCALTPLGKHYWKMFKKEVI